MSISYNIQSISQEELTNKLSNTPALLADIFQTVESKSRAWRFFKVFNAILSFINSEVIYPTRDKLGKMAGCSVEVVSDAIKYLESKGWLREVQHRYNSSNIYRISIIFYHIPLRKLLARIFPACALFLKWEFAIRVNASGAIIQRTGILLYIREEKTKSKNKKKRQSCIISSSALGRVAEGGTNEPYSWGRDSAPSGSAASEPHNFYLQTPQPPTSGSQLIKGDGMRMIIAKVVDMVPLADEQLAALDDYSDAAIQHALNRLKSSKSVTNPAAYFMYILREDAGLEHLKPTGKWSSTSSSARTDSLKREARGELNDRYKAAEIEHCEKILALFDKLYVENPSEAERISNGLPSEKWSGSWGRPKSFELRLQKLKGLY